MKTLSVGRSASFSGHYAGVPGSDISDPGVDGIGWEDSTPNNSINNPKDIRFNSSGGAAASEVQTDFLYSDFSQGCKCTFTAAASELTNWSEYNFPNTVKVNKSVTYLVYNETAITTQVSQQQHQIRLATTGNLVGAGVGTIYTQWYEQGWTHLTIGTADMTVDHSDSDIASTQLKILNDSQQARVQYIGGVVFNARSRPQLIIIFDDGRNGIYDAGKSIIAAAGLKINVGVYESVVGSSAEYCTLEELQELETNFGWEMVPHGGNSHVTTLGDDLAAIQADVESEQAYLTANFTRPHNELYVYPGGAVGTNSKQALINAGVTYARTTTPGLISTALGVPQPYYMKSATISDNNKGNLLGDIDKAINAGATTTHYGHQILTTVVDGNLDIATADFQTYITGVKARVDSGLLDVVLWSDWVDGLP